MSDMTASPPNSEKSAAPLTLVDATDSDDDDVQTDGRTMRRRRNREAVIEALISLVQEGDLAPTVAKIADRAAVSHRSIFRYFDDLDDLARTAIETEFRNTIGMSVLANPGEGTLDFRIGAIVDLQLDLLERTHLLGLVARSRSVQIPEVDRGMSTITKFRREQIRRHFEPELSQMDDDVAEAILGAVGASISFDTYDVQYRVLERNHDEISHQWRLALEKLLT